MLRLLLLLLFVCLQSTFTMDGDKFVHTQKWDGKQTTFVREVKDEKMVMVSFNSTSCGLHLFKKLLLI